MNTTRGVTKGDSGALMTLGERMSGDFPLVVMTLEQDNLPPHGHDFVELVFVNAGSAVHIHESRKYPIFAGDCFVVAPGERHGYERRDSLQITNVLFYPRILRPHASDLKRMNGFMRFFTIEPLFRAENSFRHKLHLSASQQRVVSSLIGALRAELETRSSGYRSISTGLLLQLVVQIARAFEKATAPSVVSAEFEHKRGMVEAAVAYLEQHYGAQVSVDDIARSAFISPSRLSHVFKEATGMSLMDYLIQIRIDRAQQLLAESGRSVSSVCYELGIQSPAYFTRLFRKMTGMSPSEFKATALSAPSKSRGP